MVAQRNAASGKVKQVEQVQTEKSDLFNGVDWVITQPLAALAAADNSRAPLPQFPERDGGKGGNTMDQWAA
ncbi:hypothetical protein NQ176_g40 [Zarea fungicola]|uniref:Uncharacterized protein n=1 Tax=Zarea fungicola TaxID=93591 RepID=A0ACC1NYG7_9HYPO|nr:hypothetical protein NQ176_g40 [Lecanicillium fungicola]